MKAAQKVLGVPREFGYRTSRLTGEPFELSPGEAIPGELQVIATPPAPDELLREKLVNGILSHNSTML
jgi:hypothetical protein